MCQYIGTMLIDFEIRGNQEDPTGNPIPYYRVTSQSKWSPGSKRYKAWKTYVVANYLDAKGSTPYPDRANFGDIHDLLEREPITLAKGEKVEMHIQIEWKNEAHADCDNIYKGIADALFSNDKGIARGSFDSKLSTDKRGCVRVRIATLKEA